MVKKIFFLLLLILLTFFSTAVLAQDYENMSETELSNLKDQLIKNSTSLSNQIKLISIQIAQTQQKIKSTTASISTLKNDIVDLTGKIGNLDISLNDLTAQYIQQISENYKLQKRIPGFIQIFSGNLNNYLENYTYISRIQRSSQDTLLNLETTRTDLAQEKEAKAQKQAELETLEKTLASQQKDLTAQNTIKNQLLQTTQKQLSDVLAQLSQLRNFSSAYGSSCLDSVPGKGSDGNFYSQRDPRWCKQSIGYSSDTIGAVGCYVSSIAMTFKKLGYDISPPPMRLFPVIFNIILPMRLILILLLDTFTKKSHIVLL
jgi:peptidoglycan hydrolase CwlO-like protein